MSELPIAADVIDSFADAIEFIFEPAARRAGGGQVGGLEQVWELCRRTSRSARWRSRSRSRSRFPIGVWLGHRGAGELLGGRDRQRRARDPELALIAFMVAFIGVGVLNVTIALMILGIPPILTNTFVGVRQVDRDAVEAARGMGMSELEVIRRVELPLAVPTIMSGVRTGGDQHHRHGDDRAARRGDDARRLHHQPQRLRRRRRARRRDPGGAAGARRRAALAGLQRALTPRGCSRAQRAAPRDRIGSLDPQLAEDPERRKTPMSPTPGCARCSRCSPRWRSRSRSPPAATTTTRLEHRDGGDTSATAIEENPDNNGVAADDRLEELHRADRPRRDLRPGARGRRLRRLHRPQPRLRAGRPEGARERRDQRLSGVHLDRADLVLRLRPRGRAGRRRSRRTTRARTTSTRRAWSPTRRPRSRARTPSGC